MKITIEIELEESTRYETIRQEVIKQYLVDHLMCFIRKDEDYMEVNDEFFEFQIPTNTCWDCYNYYKIINLK